MTRRTPRTRAPRITAQAAIATISIPRDTATRSREKQITLAKRGERAARRMYEEALVAVQKIDPLDFAYLKAQTTLETATALLLETRTVLRQVLAGTDVLLDIENAE